MIKLNNINLHNIVYYKDQQLDLDYKGITFLTGENLNARIKGRTNGAGKTLLANAIIGIWYPDVLQSAEMGKKVKHDMFDQKDSYIAWNVDISDVNYDIKKSREGSGIKWDIIQNNPDGSKENLNPRRIGSIAETFIKNVTPLSTEDFFSTVYLTSKRLSVLQHGTSAARHTYFTNLFRLYDFELVKKYFMDNMKELAKAKVQRDTYMESLEPVIWVKDFNVKAHAKELKSIGSTISDTKKLIKSLRKQQTKWDTYNKYKDDYEKSLGFVAGELEEVEKQLTQWRIYESYRDQASEYEEELREYKKALKECEKVIGKTKNPEKSWQKFLDKSREALSQYNVDIREYQKQLKIYRQCEEAKAELKSVSKKLKKLTKGRKTSAIEAEHIVCSKQLANIKKHKGSSCSVCGSDLPKAVKKEIIATLQKTLKSLQAEYTRAEEYEDLSAQKDRLQSEVSDVSKPKEPKKPKEYKALDLRKPKKPKTVSKPNISKNKLLKKKEKLKDLEKSSNKVDGIDESVLKGIGLKNQSKKVNKLEAEIDKLNRKHESLSIKSREYEEDLETYTSIRSKIKSIGKALKDWDILEGLIDAYGNKGIKIFVMRNIKNVIESNMNKYSNLLFPEPITFSIDIDVNVFDIYAKRKDGKESDVRSLSGGESISFMLLWFLSTLPLTPENRRTNLTILDEFEAGLDEPTRNLIIHEFLPKLQTLVDHVVFVTPYVDFGHVDNSRVVKCTKQGKETKLSITYIE